MKQVSLPIYHRRYVASLVLIVVIGLFVMLGNYLSREGRAVEQKFIATNGKQLSYGGQSVILKGVNFENISALGANIGSGNINDILVNELDYKKLSEMGGNHVRFGLSYNWYKDDPVKFYEVINNHVSWGRKHNIWITLVMFTTPANCYEGYGNTCSIWTSQSEKDTLRNAWVDIASKYKDEPVIGGYDLLNEPTPPGPGWCSTWFDYAQLLRDSISSTDPNHLVFIEACSDSQFTRVFRGGNIVYEVHDYAPLDFSHSDLSATKQYPGYAKDWDGTNVYWDKQAFHGDGNPRASLRARLPLDWVAQNNVPVYIGEWGTRQTYQGASLYIADHADLYNEWGLNHAFYTWRHDPNYWKWGIFDYTDSFTPIDNQRYDAVMKSFSNAVKPNFAGTPKAGDTDGNGKVDIFDINSILNQWGRTDSPSGDFDKSGKVDIFDLNTVLSNWGK